MNKLQSFLKYLRILGKVVDKITVINNILRLFEKKEKEKKLIKDNTWGILAC